MVNSDGEAVLPLRRTQGPRGRLYSSKGNAMAPITGRMFERQTKIV